MSAHGGPDIVNDGLVLALDAANTKSTLRKKQSSNILPDPNLWSPGTGGASGYSANGSSSEQNRLYVNDDPWGRRSVTWRTTPDATSGADGGWNSSYYSIDRSFTYRWSVWVRRYTSGTGGTFYMGLNPAPIRNDNGASQGNPYFTYPSIASLTQNQWYLVVGHCFYEGYNGGRHPDSGWYTNGVKISDPSYGNVGSQDVRWASGTTSAMHRAYHYYTTNTASGIEFAFPRIDKLDGNEPSIKELINVGESGWKGVGKNKTLANFYNGGSFSSLNEGVFSFDGTNDYISIPTFTDKPTTQITCEAWIKPTKASVGTGTHRGGAISSTNSMYLGIINSVDGGNTFAMHWANQTSNSRLYNWNGSIPNNQWSYLVGTYDGATTRAYLNGVQIWSAAQTGTIPDATYVIGTYGGALTDAVHNFNGLISTAKIYNKALTASQVLQNYNAKRKRFGL